MVYTRRVIACISLFFIMEADAHQRPGSSAPLVFTNQNAAVVDKFLLTQGPRTNPVANTVPRFEGAEARFLKTSSVLIDDQGNVTLNGVTKNGTTIQWPDKDKKILKMGNICVT